MGIIGKDFKYKLISNFLSQDEIDILNIYADMKHITNLSAFDLKQNNNGDTFYYGDAITDSLMLKKQKLMEQETGKKLLATYSFWRMYTKFAILEKHKDRPSCEISVTVNIGSDVDWPIHVDGKAISLKPGDAVIYLGQEVEHWREEFQGDWCAQVFLHYVDANGVNKEYWGTLNYNKDITNAV